MVWKVWEDQQYKETALGWAGGYGRCAVWLAAWVTWAAKMRLIGGLYIGLVIELVYYYYCIHGT